MAKDKVVFPNFYSLWSLTPAYIFGKRAALVKATPRWRVNQTANGPFNYTQLLRALASNNRVMIPSEIAEWTQTERHNITALIKRMRQDGLVTAERNCSNKRLVNITLTDKGREVLNRATPVAREIVDQVMLSIDEGDALQSIHRRSYRQAH